VSTLTLTVLEFIDAHWPTAAELRERFGCLLDVASQEIMSAFGGWPYILNITEDNCSTHEPNERCFLCCDGWREHLGAW
jgi:hypothetical protein